MYCSLSCRASLAVNDPFTFSAFWRMTQLKGPGIYGYYPLRTWRACHPRARAIRLHAHSSPAHSHALVPSLFTRTCPQPIYAHSSPANLRALVLQTFTRSPLLPTIPNSIRYTPPAIFSAFCLFVCFFHPFLLSVLGMMHVQVRVMRDTKFITVITD